jgi:hypothetical protein
MRISVNMKRRLRAGLGVGLTGASDHLIMKLILGYRFNF